MELFQHQLLYIVGCNRTMRLCGGSLSLHFFGVLCCRALLIFLTKNGSGGGAYIHQLLGPKKS